MYARPFSNTSRCVRMENMVAGRKKVDGGAKSIVINLGERAVEENETSAFKHGLLIMQRKYMRIKRKMWSQ